MINFAPSTKRRLHHYFIPSEHNGHKPHFLRHKALHFYSAAMIAVKVFVVVFAFITFPSIAEFSTVTSNRIIELTNQARIEQGLPILMHNSVLDQSAMMKAQDMLANNYFAHNRPSDGTTPWEWFKAAGYNYTFAGENLAMNFSEAEEAMSAWLASPSHKANIMNANYDEIGIAVVVGKIDGRQTTLVVQHFGKSFIKGGANMFTKATSGNAPKVAGTTQVSTGQAIEVTFKQEAQEPSFLSQLLFYGQKFFWILLIFVAINLILTIFIRIKVQHKPILFHAILVLVVGLLMIITKFHFLEAVASGSVKIL